MCSRRESWLEGSEGGGGRGAREGPREDPSSIFVSPPGVPFQVVVSTDWSAPGPGVSVQLVLMLDVASLVCFSAFPGPGAEMPRRLEVSPRGGCRKEGLCKGRMGVA